MCFSVGGAGNNLQCQTMHGQVCCANKNKGGWEQLRLKQLDGQHYVITSLRNGNNLQCQPNGDCVFANKNERLWEQFRIERKEQDVFFVSAHTNKVLQCAPSGRVRCENQNRTGWEAFRVVELGAASGSRVPSERKSTPDVPLGVDIVLTAHTGLLCVGVLEFTTHTEMSH